MNKRRLLSIDRIKQYAMKLLLYVVIIPFIEIVLFIPMTLFYVFVWKPHERKHLGKEKES